MSKIIRKKNRMQGTIFAAIILFSMAACAAPADPALEQHTEPEGQGELDHEDGEVMRIPNDGAAIAIVSPEQGAVYAAGEDIVVEVSIENFTLNQDGTHWHVYVDGISYGMVVGETTTQVLRNLETGKHTITAYLANGDHEELEDGGEVMITVVE